MKCHCGHYKGEHTLPLTECAHGSGAKEPICHCLSFKPQSYIPHFISQGGLSNCYRAFKDLIFKEYKETPYGEIEINWILEKMCELEREECKKEMIQPDLSLFEAADDNFCVHCRKTKENHYFDSVMGVEYCKYI